MESIRGHHDGSRPLRGALGRTRRFVRRLFHRKAQAQPWRAVLVLAFFTSSVCFLGSSLYTKLRTREIAAQTHVVSTTALPRMLHLVGLRSEIRTLEREMIQAIRGARTLPAGRLDTFDSELEEFIALSPIEGEAQIWNEAQAALESFRTHAHHVMQRMEDGDFAQADEHMIAHLQPSARDADEAVVRVIDVSARHSSEAASAAERSRVGMTAVGLALDASSVLVSGIAVLVAVRAVRRHTRLVEERAHELEQFAARVAHDVRGPLSPALVALQWVENRADDETTRRMAERGKRSVQRVVGIVDGLFAFAQGHVTVDTTASASVRNAFDDVTMELELLARERDVAIRIAPFEDVKVACTSGVLASVLSNLMRNAIKYIGERPTREVLVRIARRDELVRIEIEDSGPGLPKGMGDRVFEPYVRGEHEGEGLGLGLATVKKLIEAHHGRVGVRVNDDRGTTFWFELPHA